MASPNRRRSKKRVEQQTSNQQRERRVRARTNNEPREIQPQIYNPTDYVGLHTEVGELNLDPYVWITISGDSEEITTRNGLRSIHISNEESKYPRVSFTLYLPNFRDEEKGTQSNDYFVPSEPGRAITKLHLGAHFSVSWGYKTNTVKWGVFRVTERNIAFEEGTALLRVTGLIGARLKSIVTSEVFSTSQGKSSIEKMAKRANISVSTRYLTKEEKDRLYNDTAKITPKGDDLGQAIYKKVRELDIDMRFATRGNVLYLETPFKRSLGKKPRKLTYGYPTSNISTIQVNTKHPIKKGESPRYQTRLNQTVTKTGGFDEQTQQIIIAIEGPLLYRDSKGVDRELIIGAKRINADGRWIFPTYETDDNGNRVGEGTSPDLAIQNAQKKWKPENGYRVSLVPDGGGRSVKNPDSYAVLVERIINVKGTLFQESVTFSSLDLYYQKNSQARYRSGDFTEIYVLLNEPPNELGHYKGIKYTLGSEVSKKDVKPVETKKPSDRYESSQVEAVPNLVEDTPEGFEFVDVIGYLGGKLTSASIDNRIIGNRSLSDLSQSDRDKLKEYQNHLQHLNNLAESESDLRVVQQQRGELSVAKIQKRVRKVPSEPSTGKNPNQSTSDTGSSTIDKPSSSFVPASLQSGVGRPSRRTSTTDLSIKLKAGDHSLNIGDLIRIDSLHKKIDGVYYIHREQHTIGVDGFHTTINCKRAVYKLVDQHQSKDKSVSIDKGQSGTTRVPVGTEEAERVAVIDKDESNRTVEEQKDKLDKEIMYNEINKILNQPNVGFGGI